MFPPISTNPDTGTSRAQEDEPLEYFRQLVGEVEFEVVERPDENTEPPSS